MPYFPAILGSLGLIIGGVGNGDWYFPFHVAIFLVLYYGCDLFASCVIEAVESHNKIRESILSSQASFTSLDLDKDIEQLKKDGEQLMKEAKEDLDKARERLKEFSSSSGAVNGQYMFKRTTYKPKN